jgi:hypothetical protein
MDIEIVITGSMLIGLLSTVVGIVIKFTKLVEKVNTMTKNVADLEVNVFRKISKNEKDIDQRVDKLESDSRTTEVALKGIEVKLDSVDVGLCEVKALITEVLVNTGGKK